jgi:hypothetical protein
MQVLDEIMTISSTESDETQSPSGSSPLAHTQGEILNLAKECDSCCKTACLDMHVRWWCVCVVDAVCRSGGGGGGVMGRIMRDYV